MKLTTSLNIIILCFVSLTLPLAGHGQVYQTSRTVSGTISGPDPVGHWLYALNQVPTFNVTGGSLLASVYVDGTASTIREVGTISLPSTLSTTLYETQTVGYLPPVFPNPPQIITASGQLTLGLSFNQNPISFDTGARNMFWNGSSWAFDAPVRITVPATLSYSLLTGGQTYTGSLQENFSLLFQVGSLVDIADYPNSLRLPSQASVLGGLTYEGSTAVLVDLTAENGYKMQIKVTPEPSTVSLLGLGLFGFLFLRRRQG